MKINGRFITSLKMSVRKKNQANWSKKVSRGFLAEEILDATRNAATGNITIIKENGSHTAHISEYNLPETEELLKWAEYQDGNSTTPARKIPYEE